jgi:hypothetical protein
MKVPGMSEGGLEPGAAFAEVHLAGHARADHPLQRPVDGGAADPRIFLADEIAQVVRTQVAFLAKKDAQDAVAFARPLPAGGPKPFDIRERSIQRPLLGGERLAAAAG